VMEKRYQLVGKGTGHIYLVTPNKTRLKFQGFRVEKQDMSYSIR